MRHLPQNRPARAEPLALAAVLATVAVAAIGTHRRGISWGDDFTLYLRQAKALFEGNVGQVIADNHDNVRLAAKPGFSPDVYPWGWPLIAAPFVRLFGFDYGRLKLVEVACWLGFLTCLYALARRRLPDRRWLPIGLIAVVGTSLTYLRHTGQLLSELPYLMVVGVTLCWLDRCRDGRKLDEAPTRDLVVLGLLAMAAFNVRREGVAMAAALAAVGAVDLHGRWRTADRRRMATPLAAFTGGVIAAQLVLPSALAPHYDGAGLGTSWEKISGPFGDAFRDGLGLSAGWGWLGWVVFCLAVIGVVVRLRRAPGDDIAMVVFPVLSMVIVGMHPAAGARYLLPITPFAVYFALQALVLVPWRPVPAAVLAAVCAGHLALVPGEWRRVAAANERGVQDGPAAPYAQAAFDAVARHTRRDDIVAFFKARAMTLYTDRRAVQSSELGIVLARADWFMMRRGSDHSQPLVSDAEAGRLGLIEVWSDETWVLWRIPEPTGSIGG